MWNICKTGATLVVSTMLLLAAAPSAQSHPCVRDPSPSHKHCSGSGGDQPKTIPGCATFSSGPITGDGQGTYCDDDPTTNPQNEPDVMQVGMHCEFNHFNLYPGGGQRRIRLDIFSTSVPTGITSCLDSSGDPVPITFIDTDMDDPVQDCANTDPDWAFFQHMRTQALGDGNVCEMADGDSLTATMRFQSHLNHLRSCKGGVKKCGTWQEPLEVNYDGDSCSGLVTITCTAVSGGACGSWTVSSSGPGCLTHASGGAGTSEALPFAITFKAN
jgi:hypothetical protein